MLSFLLLLSTASAGSTSFVFVGQPECVELEFDGAATQLRNGCLHPLLIDQSVLLGTTGGAQVAAHTEATLRDLSAFTIGMDGRLYRAVAMIAEPAHAAVATPKNTAPKNTAPENTAPKNTAPEKGGPQKGGQEGEAADDGSWSLAALGAMTGWWPFAG